MTEAITQKYAKALLEVARERDDVSPTLVEIQELIQIFKDSQLDRFFKSRFNTEDQKVQILDLLKKESSRIIQNFLDTVALNGRLQNLFAILQEVKNAADDLFKISDLEVTSAVPMTDVQLDQVSTLAKKKMNLEIVNIHNLIDDKIIGGFIIKSRGKVIDASLKSQLEKIAQSLI